MSQDPKVLIIDNYDSFTHILKQYFGELGANPEVFFNDGITIDQIREMKPTHIVLSPGPGTVEEPKDVGVMFELIEAFHKTLPILGVCLGHQALGKFFGASIVRAPKIMHGKRSLIEHDGVGVFEGVSSPLEVMRYHSLALELRAESSELRAVAKSKEGVVMAVQHKELPLYGVQFHPESLGTKEGMKLLQNFLTDPESSSG